MCVYYTVLFVTNLVWPFKVAGVEINTGPLARGQWISCWASRICFALARLASKILKPYFWVDMN